MVKESRGRASLSRRLASLETTCSILEYCFLLATHKIEDIFLDIVVDTFHNFEIPYLSTEGVY